MRDHTLIKSRLGLFLVIVIWLTFTGVFVHHLGYFHRPLASDAAVYQRDAARFYVVLVDQGLIAFFKAAFHYSGSHPPLLPLLGAIAALPFGEPDGAALWTVIAFFSALLVYSTWRLACHVLPPEGALLAAALTVFCPTVFVNSRPFYTQMPMIALVCCALNALVTSRTFSRTGPSLMFGAWTGLAVLMKQLAPVYLIGAASTALVFGLCNPKTRRVAAKNAAIAGLAAAFWIGLWYPFHLDSIFSYTQNVVSESGQEFFSSGIPLFSLARWLYYPRALISEGFGPPLAILVLVSLVFLGRQTRRLGLLDPITSPLVVGVISSYIIITVGQVAAGAFYMMHLLPLGCICLVNALRRLRRKHLAAAAGLLALSASTTLHFATRTVDDFPVRPRVFLGIDLNPAPGADLINYCRAVGAKNNGLGEPWPLREWMAKILQNTPRDLPRVSVVTNGRFQQPLLHHPFVEGATLEYEAALARRNIQYTLLQSISDADEMKEFLRRVDWLILDERIVGLDDANRWIEFYGAAATPVDRREVTFFSRLTLLQMQKSWRLGQWLRPEDLQIPGIHRQAIEFANGVKLVGFAEAERAGRQDVVIFLDLSSRKDSTALRLILKARAGGKTTSLLRQDIVTQNEHNLPIQALSFDDLKPVEGLAPQFFLSLEPIATRSSAIPVASGENPEFQGTEIRLAPN